jgi:hypothetical protein
MLAVLRHPYATRRRRVGADVNDVQRVAFTRAPETTAESWSPVRRSDHLTWTKDSKTVAQRP